MEKTNTLIKGDYNSLDFSNRLYPGSVIITDYVKFDGSIEKGIFLVLYNEEYDLNNDHRYNLVCCKITSQLQYTDAYSVSFNRKDVPFLKYDSVCMCSKLHTILRTSNNITVAGVIKSNVLLNVYKQYMKFHEAVNSQIISNIGRVN